MMLQRATEQNSLQRRIGRSAVERGLSQRRLFDGGLRSDGGVGAAACVSNGGRLPKRRERSGQCGSCGASQCSPNAISTSDQAVRATETEASSHPWRSKEPG